MFQNIFLALVTRFFLFYPFKIIDFVSSFALTKTFLKVRYLAAIFAALQFFLHLTQFKIILSRFILKRILSKFTFCKSLAMDIFLGDYSLCTLWKSIMQFFSFVGGFREESSLYSLTEFLATIIGLTVMCSVLTLFRGSSRFLVLTGGSNARHSHSDDSVAVGRTYMENE